MSNALHDYAKLFERYAANNNGMGVILAGEDCLALANEMRMDADDIDAENAKLREAVEKASEIIVESCGECPVSRYEWLSWDRCAEECEVGKEPECWAKYLTGDLGVEVK